MTAFARTRVRVPVAPVWAGPASVRAVDEAAVRDDPDVGQWRAALDLDTHLDLLHRVVTQALVDEAVIVVGERDGWSEVRLPEQPSSLSADGYPGWIRSAHLRASGAGEDSPAAPPPVRGADAPALALRIARLFFGKPYFWAGLSGYGVDCSGLVHLSYRCLGIRVPRDAHDQAAFFAPIAVPEARPGDPVFFENASGIHHVGLALGDGRMLHSPRCDRLVSVDPIGSGDYTGERITAGRLVAD